MQDIYWYNKN